MPNKINGENRCEDEAQDLKDLNDQLSEDPPCFLEPARKVKPNDQKETIQIMFTNGPSTT
jgi:hypothetical protein